MTTTQINGVGCQVVSGSRQTAAAKETSDGSFASMMSASISNQADKVSASQTGGSANAVKTAEKQTVSKAEKAQTTSDKQKTSKADEVSEKAVDKKPAADKTEKPEDAEGMTEGVEVPNELAGKVKEALQEIKALAEDVLDLDQEELNAIMEQLGVTMVDLLNPQVLQQIVVKAADGNDFSVLLTDENAAMNLQELLSGVQDILAEAGLKQEEILPLLQNDDFAKMLEQVEAVATEEVEETAGNQELAEESVETDAVAEEESETTFQFEAVREETKAGDSKSGSNMTKQDSQMFTSQAEQFLNQLTQTAETSFSELPQAEQIREIANQILEKVKVLIQPNQTSMEITLNPESLGKVSLSIVSKQGIMTAQFTTQTEAAKAAIESQMSVFRENLQNQGLKVEAIEVSVSEFAFQQSDLNNTDTSGQHQGQERKTARRSLTLEEAVSMDEVTEEESIALDMMARNGNQVDFMA